MITILFSETLACLSTFLYPLATAYPDSNLAIILPLYPPVSPSCWLSVHPANCLSILLTVWTSCWLSVHPADCLSILLSVSLFFWLSVHPAICQSILLTVRPSSCLSAHPPDYIPLLLPVYQPVCPSSWLTVHPPDGLSILLTVSPSSWLVMSNQRFLKIVCFRFPINVPKKIEYIRFLNKKIHCRTKTFSFRSQNFGSKSNRFVQFPNFFKTAKSSVLFL